MAKVVAYDTCAQNELGSEWIPTGKFYDSPPADSWESMALKLKVYVTPEITDYVRKLESLNSSTIEDLYFKGDAGRSRKDNTKVKRTTVFNNPDFEISTMVLVDFFTYNRVQLDLNRRSFLNQESWINTLTQTET